MMPEVTWTTWPDVEARTGCDVGDPPSCVSDKVEMKSDKSGRLAN